MLRRSELPLLEDDSDLFETPPEWLLPGLRSARLQGDDDPGLGWRALADRWDVPPKRLPASASPTERKVDMVRRRSRRRMWSSSARVALQRAAADRGLAARSGELRPSR